MVRAWRAGHYGRMFLLLLASLGGLGLLFVLALRYSDAVNAALGAVPDWLRRRAWGVLLVPLALLYALISANGYVGAAEVVVAIAFVVFAPRAAAAAVPFATLGLGCWGLALFNRYRQGFPVLTRYGLVPPQFSGPAWYLLLQAVVFLACGLWLLVTVKAPGSGPVSRAASWLWHPHGGVPQWAGLLLLPVLAVAAELLGLHHWFGFRWVTPGLAIAVFGAVLAAAVVLILRSRIWAATLAAAGLVALGVYGILLAAYWPGIPGASYGLAQISDPGRAVAGGGLQGCVLLAAGLWLAPLVVREHLHGPDADLAARAEQLTRRVETLTQTRTDAVGTAAAELRRIERDLHDGAQARLVALGMSLQAAEKLFRASPDAALALISEAKDTSSRALADLRDLVRGIYPPVLADRGLCDAIKALALDTPLHTVVDVDLPGEVDTPVGSAVYFAVAEVLANAAKHSGARTVRVQLGHQDGALRAQITDDGAGGADPGSGTGLRGVERRLATFDGILAVSSPPGGPTIVVIEVPCALSSPKTSSC